MPPASMQCSWTSLRSGSFGSALYTMIYFAVTIVMVVVFGVVEDDAGALDDQLLQHSGLAVANISYLADDHRTLHTLNICVVTLSSFGLASTFLLLYGLSKRIREYMLPWIGVVSSTTGVDLIYAVYLLAHEEALTLVSALVFVGDFILVVVNVYCILCVVSQYHEIKEHERSTQRMLGLAVTDDLLECGQSLSQHHPVEEVKLGDVRGCAIQSGEPIGDPHGPVAVET